MGVGACSQGAQEVSVEEVIGDLDTIEKNTTSGREDEVGP